MTYFTYAESPLRDLLLVSDGHYLTGLYMAGQQYERTPLNNWIRNDDLPLFRQAKSELKHYFSGDLISFSIPVRFDGTHFQQSVWTLLMEIPYGKTMTYGALASLLGDPLAARTVGHTIGMNPISVVIPCHRVIASNGKLTGYNGGLERKRLLLDLEQGMQRLALDI